MDIFISLYKNKIELYFIFIFVYKISMQFVCFVCSDKMTTITHRAFDQNYCSTICMNICIEINQFLDPSFHNPDKWVKSKEDIEIIQTIGKDTK